LTPKSVGTFTATIYVGLRYHYDGQILDKAIPMASIQEYVDEIGLCVTVADTQFVYTNGGEPGLVVGLINYPRFPSTPEAIREKALTLAKILLDVCRQCKVSVVMPDETVMLECDPTLRTAQPPAGGCASDSKEPRGGVR
jgi:hypothetical protein